MFSLFPLRSYMYPIYTGTATYSPVSWVTRLGTSRNCDGDGKQNVKKAIGLMSKTTTLHVHHAFLYISLLSLHNYNVKWPNFKFTWERERQGDEFHHFCLNSGVVSSLQFQPKFPSFK